MTELTPSERLAAIEVEVKNLNKKSQTQGETLIDISKTLKQISTQGQRLTDLERRMLVVETKQESLRDPENGTLSTIKVWQASCPRKQIKAIWVIVIPMGLTLIAMAYKLIAGV